MDVRLKPFDFAQAAARAGLAPNGQPLGGARQATATGASFSAWGTSRMSAWHAVQASPAWVEALRAAWSRPRILLPNSRLYFALKKSASSGMSSFLSLRGGSWIVTTLSR